MGCCGNKNGGKRASTQLEYEVTLNNGTKKRVKTMDEVRLALAVGGGGGYRSVPVKPEVKPEVKPSTK